MGNTSSTRLGGSLQASGDYAADAGSEAGPTTPRAWLHHISARNALIHAADQGNLALLKLICDDSEGRTFHGVSDGASKGQAPLMRACSHVSVRHTECVAYLLVCRADVYAQNSRGDNAMHIAAKHGNAGALQALLSFRPHADGEDGSQLLGDIVVQGDAGPTRFIDLHNGSGLTALHLAALKGSHAAVRELLRAGASADIGTLSGVHSPQLSRGSTALHIAAFRGHAACVGALLDHQVGIPGMELQRLRNARGLKPSQLARLAGHHSVARLLSEVIIAGSSHSLTSAAPGSSGAPGEQLPRRAVRAALPARAALVARAELGRLPASAAPGRGISQEALLAALTQRAKLLLSLRATTLGHDSSQQDAGPESSEEAALAEVAAEIAAALRSKGFCSGSAETSNTLLGLLASLADTSSEAAPQHPPSASSPEASVRGASAHKALAHGLDRGGEVDMQAGDDPSNRGGEKVQAREDIRTAKSYAAGALVQAALNAMAVSAPSSEPFAASGDFLAPAASVAAVIAVQAAMKKLGNQRIGVRLMSAPAGQLPSARGGPAMSTAGGLQRASSGLSLRSTASTAGVLNASNSGRGRRRRRHNALRLSLSGNLSRHGAASEVTTNSAVAASQAAAPRRRRHRRNGSFGSLGYPTAQPGGLSPRHPISRGRKMAAAEISTGTLPLDSALETAAPSVKSGLSGRIEQATPECAPSMMTVREGASNASGPPSPAGQGLAEANSWEQPRDSTATELPEEWVTALHSGASMGAPVQSPLRGATDNAAGSVQDKTAAGNGATEACREQASSSQSQPSRNRSSGGLSKLNKRHHQNEPDLLDEEIEPLLPSDRQLNARPGSAAAQDGHHGQNCEQLQVRSRLFSTSEDAPLGAHPQALASSPTNPFDTAEILGSDSIPSSPFGDSTADEWLHVQDCLLESGSGSGTRQAWPAEDLMTCGSFLQTDDLEFIGTDGCESLESRDAQWQSALSQDCGGLDSLHETVPIEAIMPEQEAAVLRTPPPAPGQPPMEAHVTENPASREPSVPLPGTAAAQVAEAFGKRTTFHRQPPQMTQQGSGQLAAARQSLRSSLLAPASKHSNGEDDMGTSTAGASYSPIGSLLQSPDWEIMGGSVMERQDSATPAPGAAAAEVRRAFAKITCSSGTSSGEIPCAEARHGVHSLVQANSGSEGHGEQPIPAAEVPAESAPLHQQPAGAGMQAHVAAADSSSANGLQDQGLHAAVSGVSVSRSHRADIAAKSAINSISGESPKPELAGAARAMSLKGIAAADTARAFSRLRGRGRTSSAARSAPFKAAAPAEPASVAAQPPAPASRNGPPHGEPAAHGDQFAQPLAAAALAASSTPESWQIANKEAGPDSSRPFDLWGQQDAGPSSSTEPGKAAGAPEASDPDQLLQSTEELLMDFFLERSAAESNSTMASSSQAPASTGTAAAQHFGVESAADMRDKQAMGSSGMPLPQSAFHQDSAEVGDAEECAQESTRSPRQAQEGEARMKLPHSRGDAKGASPRKRASLGRRLSGMLPGVKGKERARTTSASKEMCSICMDSGLDVAISGCQHSLCRQCAYQLCARGLAPPLCPFCRGTIQHFKAILMPKPQAA